MPPARTPASQQDYSIVTSIKGRVTRLEASAPVPVEDRITEIHRIILGQFNSDGSPVVIVRRGQPYR